ncbi:MAG: trypsin-like peptidase domain-containing protein [Oscillatoria princeps RMCB-10]|jgi:hypothetical protein|nr:trypsin-like peptidase domain-containing protein [Oscillatoria princeps RMCB-10]
MGKIVVLHLADGNFEDGFRVILQIREDGNIPSTQITGKLPPCPEIEKDYSSWKLAYGSLAGSLRRLDWRLGAPANQLTNISPRMDVQKAMQVLSKRLNTWLNSESFRPVKEKLLQKFNPSEEIRVIIQTEDIRLRRLPWHLWDFFEYYPKAEVAFSATGYQKTEISAFSRKQVSILAILGNSADIDIQKDRKLLENLPKAETRFLVEPLLRELYSCLWDDQGWDILFFAGHSLSQGNSKPGRIYINKNDSLTMGELKYALRKSIERGLKLAIFNSCDGLGLVRDLEELHIPQVIVMREPVPDRVAQEFLNHFIKAFSSGKSLYASVREAREKLQSIEDEFPCASWLPVICQNPAEEPVTWQGLQHRSRAVSPKMTWAKNKLPLLAGAVGVASLLLAAVVGRYNVVNPVRTSPSDSDTASSKVTFTCKTVSGAPTTVAKNAQGERQLIRWGSNVFSQAGYTPQKRCQEVTERMNRYFKQGGQYITHGVMKNQKVICITDRVGEGCTGLLYTLKPDQDAKATLEDLFQLNNRNVSSGPLRESSCPIYVNLNDIIAGKEVVAKEVCGDRTEKTRDIEENEIRQIAKQTAVIITGRGSGSGVIVRRDGNTYYVLTSKHVVGIAPGAIDDPYVVQTYDGIPHKITYEKVRKAGHLDLAILEFSSQRSYEVAKISPEIAEGMPVYIAGWIDCNSDRKYQFSAGQIDQLSADDEEGYSVRYTNSTITGMSGSPVFDRLGRVVAIHGKPGSEKQNQYDFEKCPSLSQTLGGNWGIPIKTFLNTPLASSLELEIDRSKVKLNFSAPEIDENNQSNTPPIFWSPGDSDSR